MFKADPQTKTSANIKSSERRNLYTRICQQLNLPKEKISKDVERTILPAIIKESGFRTARNDEGYIYDNSSDTPVWFEGYEDDSPLYPSIFTLWNAPALIPMVFTHPHVVNDALRNGAHLMLPGCILPFDSRIKKGDIVGVCGSDAPYVAKAVGEACMDLGNIDNVVGTRGLAVKIVHWLGDGLYKLNTHVDISVPKELDPTTPWEVESSSIAEKQNQDAATPMESIEPSKDTTAVQETTENDLKEISNEMEELSVKDLDHLFTRALLQAIKVEDIEVPVKASTFMSNYVLKNLPMLDSKYKSIKKTSWKKSSKYLKAMNKLGYIQIKGKDEDLSIISTLPKTDNTIVNFITHKIDKPKGSETESKDNNNTLQVIRLYQPINRHRMFFNKAFETYNQLYDIKTLTTILNDYIKEHDLSDKKDPKFILADEALSGCLSKPKIARKDLTQDFIKHMTKKYVILKPGENIEEAQVFNGEVPKVEIVCETRIGRKTVTRVRNFEVFGIKPFIITEELRNLCQGSSTLEEIRGQQEVMVQGPHYKLVHKYLVDKGIPASFITFEDKSKKKKKKRS